MKKVLAVRTALKNYKETGNFWGHVQKINIKKTFEFKIMRITFNMKSSEFMGRFGGGWNWAIGFEVSKSFKTIILKTLVCYWRIEFGRKHKSNYINSK